MENILQETDPYGQVTWLDILQPEIIHGRPQAIRTLRRSARLFYYTKDSLSNENKYVDPLSFLRKTTTISTLDKTDKDLLGPSLVRVFDRTNHLVICITLCRLKNYITSRLSYLLNKTDLSK